MIITRYPLSSPFNVRNQNKLAALDRFQLSSGGVSRADEARFLSLSRSMVNVIVNDLLEHNVIRKADRGPKTGERRPVMLEGNPEGGCVAFIDMGTSHLKIALTDLPARLFREDALSFQVGRGPQESLSQIDSQLQRLLESENLYLDQVLAAGVGVPGSGVAEKGDMLLEPIRLTDEAHSLRAAANSMRITSATLGRRSSSMGAVVQALTKALHTLIDD